MKNLPVCDGTSTLWQNYIYGEGGIIDLWFDLGIDGLRLDVADELTDEFIKVGRIQYYIIFLMASGLVLVGKEFFNIWAGHGYEDAYYIALLLIIPLEQLS